MVALILVLFINGQELHLADMEANDCFAAVKSIWAAGGDAICVPDDSPLLGTPN